MSPFGKIKQFRKVLYVGESVNIVLNPAVSVLIF